MLTLVKICPLTEMNSVYVCVCVCVHDTTPKMGSSARRYPFINRSFITPVKHLLGIYVVRTCIFMCVCARV